MRWGKECGGGWWVTESKLRPRFALGNDQNNILIVLRAVVLDRLRTRDDYDRIQMYYVHWCSGSYYSCNHKVRDVKCQVIYNYQ